MKKIISIIISGVILLALTACGDKADKKDNFMNEGYLFWSNEDFPSYLDYETMEITMLCNIPNCTHTTSSCIGAIVKNNQELPVIYDHCAYYFINTMSRVEKNGKHVLDLKATLMKYDFEKIETSKIAEITGYNTNSNGCLINSKCYFTTNYGNPSYDESGNVWASSNSGGGNFFSVDLDNGEVKDYGEIFDYELLKNDFPAADSSTSFSIVGKNNDELYLNVSYQKERPSREFLEQGIGTDPPFYGDTYIFNLKTNEVRKISNQRVIDVMNGYCSYFNGGDEDTLIIKNLSTNEITEINDYSMDSTVRIYNDKVWRKSTCLDIKTGHKVTYTDLNFAKVIDVYEENYIVKGEDSDGNIVFEKIPCEEIDSLFE